MTTSPGAARRPIIGGNWKMNTDRAGARALAKGVCEGVAGLGAGAGAEVVVFPPFPYLLEVAEELAGARGKVRLGAQDVYPAANGAFTGEVSMDMLRDCCVQYVLAGHSERRHVIGETDEVVNAKVRAILGSKGGGAKGDFTCVLCVGEKLEERKAGRTDEVNERQLRAGLAGVTAEQMRRVVVAYEPVWAIGTGVTATPGDAQDAQAKIRGVLAGMFGGGVAAGVRIQYGGSVKGSNAAELMGQADVDGALVGGASLDAADFCRIVGAAKWG